MEKRAFLAIVISMFIIIAVPPLLVKLFPQLKQERNVLRASEKSITPVTQTQEVPKPEKQIEPILGIEDKNIDFENEEYKVTFSAIKGAINSVILKKYKDSGGKPMLLAETAGSGNAIFAEEWFTPDLDKMQFSYSIKGERAIFTAKSADGLTVEKEYIFQPDKYCIEFKQTVTNNSSQSRPLKYSIVGSSGITSLSPQDTMYVELVRDIDGKVSNINKRSVKNGMSWEGSQVNWVSLKNKYFSLITKPPASFPKVYSNKLKDNELQTRIESPEFTVGPNASVTHNFILYAGPNDYSKISGMKLGLEESLYLGFIGSIGKILFVILEFFHKIVKNWGLAIITLTAFINILLFPLTFKGIKAMKQMQALQPKMEALRKAHKDNPQKVNKEMMELYRKYKINPMGGCLPMLLQMPVFFALYQVLMRSIELRGASFLWIKDLSQPDRLVVLNSPIPLIGNDLNILPILMAVAMFLQQKFSAPPASGSSDQMAQQQKMMAVMMPILFGFMFYRLPSGLVMYWFTNTLLTLGEQELFLKKQVFHVEHSED